MITCVNRSLTCVYFFTLDDYVQCVISYEQLRNNQNLKTLCYRLFDQMHDSNCPNSKECEPNTENVQLFFELKACSLEIKDMRQPKTRQLMEASRLV